MIAKANCKDKDLTNRIEGGQTDLADCYRAHSDGGKRLARPMDVAALAVLQQQLNAESSTVDTETANGRVLDEPERTAVIDALTGVFN